MKIIVITLTRGDDKGVIGKQFWMHQGEDAEKYYLERLQENYPGQSTSIHIIKS